jgi:23S rRNA pseudouridine2605 synthase
MKPLTWMNQYSPPLKGLLFLKSRIQYPIFFSTKIEHQVDKNLIRLSKVITQYSNNMPLSRNEAERMIVGGEVTIAGQVIHNPAFLISLQDAKSTIKVAGKLVQVEDNATKKPIKPRVWAVHKLSGEIVSENDPQGRPSLIERLRRGGVGKRTEHLKAIGRLDMSSEGLILVTNDGTYKRELELPSNHVHRTYRARVHGELTPYKLRVLRRGITIDRIQYQAMKVGLESPRGTPSTNHWMRLTCTEGKNRQIRKVLQHLGLTVTRLIRVSFGDYDLNTIPAGMAIEVPVKPLENQKKVGLISQEEKPNKRNKERVNTNPVLWVNAK